MFSVTSIEKNSQATPQKQDNLKATESFHKQAPIRRQTRASKIKRLHHKNLKAQLKNNKREIPRHPF